MRGQQERSGSLFSYVSIEERIPASHPLRRIWKLADQALDRRNPTFCRLAICSALDALLPAGAPHSQLIARVSDRPGHDQRYAIDPTRIST